MSSSPLRRGRLAARGLTYAAALALAAFLVFLPFAGRYLIHEQPLAKSDAILVLAGARVERWLEAVDLYREGWAPRVVLSPGRIEQAEIGLRARGIAFPTEADLARDAMVRLDVPRPIITILPAPLDNTAEEATAMRPVAVSGGWRRLIVVTSGYHTRRAAFAFARAFDGSGIDVIVRATRHEPEPARWWWTNRADVRWVVSELQKLLAYRLGLSG